MPAKRLSPIREYLYRVLMEIEEERKDPEHWQVNEAAKEARKAVRQKMKGAT